MNFQLRPLLDSVLISEMSKFKYRKADLAKVMLVSGQDVGVQG